MIYTIINICIYMYNTIYTYIYIRKKYMFTVVHTYIYIYIHTATTFPDVFSNPLKVKPEARVPRGRQGSLGMDRGRLASGGWGGAGNVSGLKKKVGQMVV